MAGLPAQVAKVAFALELASLVKHGRGEVNAGDVSGADGGGAGNDAGAAGDIEDEVGGAKGGRLELQVERGRGGVGRHGGEGGGGTAEDIDD